MYSPWVVIAFICLYVGTLFLVALWVERGSARAAQVVNKPIVYALALAVYCTSWTFYGSVGSAASAGMLFLTIYLGPTLAIIFWWFVLRKLVRIKSTQRITSIADFISARYSKSALLAAIATVIALVGTTPYIALQLKAVTSTFTLITAANSPSDALLEGNIGPIVVGLMILFTILFGVRRLDPTERHRGVVTVLAIESIVKLIAFLAVGVFVTFFMYDGFGDIFQRLSESPFRDMTSVAGQSVSSYITWMTYLVLAMSAILFLPRQFHVAVVENSNENHIKTAMWFLPLYLFLINIFVVPIAAGGLLQGRSVAEADTFVLTLPLLQGQPWLALLAFIGGFSAATGMVVVSTMTLATMTTNHLLLPAIERIDWLRFMRRHLLKARWVAVTGVLLLGFWVERVIGDSYTLVNMGIIAFAAALQFAPAVLGGLFWRRGNRVGAVMGLTTGFLIWFYTLLLPSFVKSGWLSNRLLDNGPWGIQLLKPEQLFGLVELAPVNHTVFWSMLFNIGLYVLCSLYFKQSEEENRSVETFVNALAVAPVQPLKSVKADIDLTGRKELIRNLLTHYFTDSLSDTIIERSLNEVGLSGRSQVSVVELTQLYSQIKSALAGSIGAASAHQAMHRVNLFTGEEAKQLSEIYGQILADLKVSPEELYKRIDYYQERDSLLAAQAAELEEQVRVRTRALRIEAEVSHQLTTILDRRELLQNVVNHIQTELDFYHTHVYLIEEETGDLVLAEGSGQVGQQLKAKGHRLTQQQGIVGMVASTARAFKSDNVEEIENFVRNPLLPDTKSELAVPLLKGDQVLGVLDIQSKEVGRFSEEDVSLLQSIANQTAIAVDNARLVARTQTALREVERLNRRLTHDAWVETVEEKEAFGYRFRGGMPQAITKDSNVWSPPMKEAVKKKQLVKMSRGGNGDKSQSELGLPLMLRGQVIGVLGVKREKQVDWTDEEVSAVNAVADQISRALENARLSEEQEKTIEQLKEIDRLKSEFLTSMSHELRTPLNSIIGFADVLLQGIDGDLPDMAVNDIRLIHSSGQHLLALINDILDLSKIEAGKMELIREPIDIGESINDVLAASNSLVKDKPVEILVDKPDDLPPLYADKLRLNQILLNLVSNAAKFTDEGSITIKANIDEENPDKMRVAVIDTGIGIPEEKQHSIFDRFRQADGTTTRKYGGTGLGLAITLNLTEMHDGELKVKSEPNGGSEFFFTIPLANNHVEQFDPELLD